MIIEDTSEKLYNQVADDLKSRILRNDFGPDGRLPNFKELSEAYKVSLSTIKKSMQLLNDQNLIVSRVGRGTFTNISSTNQEAIRNRVKSNNIGLLIRDLDGPYFSGIYQGLSEMVREYDKRLMVTLTIDDQHQEEAMYKMLVDQVEGLLVTTSRKSLYGVSIFEKLLKLRMPFVILHDVYDTPTYCFDVDNYKGGQMAAERLLSHGLKRYAVIVGEMGYRVDDMRLKGFTDALRSAGVAVESDCFVLRASLGAEATAFDEGYKLGMSLDIKGIGFEGIFLFNDLIAMGFQKALLERGFSIPEDIKVVGFDNIDRCSEARIPLTTISVPRRTIGQMAIKQINEIILSNSECQPERILLEPELIVRHSA
jgi:DNA-binding LacI/PurR family transcriptional regulator